MCEQTVDHARLEVRESIGRRRSASFIGRFMLLVIGLLGFDYEVPAWGQESSLEATNLYTDAAGFQNAGQFDLAAKEWEQFLKRFPQDPLAGKARHYAGVCRLQLGQHTEAAAHFAEVVKQLNAEFREESLWNLGWCQYSLATQGMVAQYGSAEQTWAQLLKQFPKGKFADAAWFYTGESHYARKRLPEAVVAYRQLTELFPSSTLRCEAMYAWGVTEEEQGHYAEAGKVYDQFLKACSEHNLATEVRMRKAETIFQGGDIAAARQTFEELSRKEGFAAADHAAFRAAECAARQEQFTEAGQLYSDVVSRFPDSPYAARVPLAAGLVFYRAQDDPQAAKWLEKAVLAGGVDAPEAAHWLCRILLRGGQPAKAVELAGRILPLAEKSEFLVDLRMDEADGLYEQPERRADARERFQAIADQFPQHRLAPQALYNVAFTELTLKQLGAAREHADAFLKLYPDDTLRPDALAVRAEALLLDRQFAPATEAYGELLSQYVEHPERDLWHVRQGLALLAEKKFDELTTALQPRLGKFKQPNLEAEATYLVGAAQIQQQRWELARDLLVASRKASTSWARADLVLLLLAQAQQQLGDASAARATVEQLLADYPQSSLLDQAQYRLGQAWDALSKFQEADAAYALLLQKWPDSPYAPFAAYNQGWSRVKADDPLPGAEAFTKLVTTWPDHPLVPQAKLGRGTCRRLQGQFSEALPDVTAFLESKPTGAAKLDALYELGQIQVGLKQFAPAAKSFQTILDENPQYQAADNVRYQLAWAWKDQGDSKQAVESFRRLITDHPRSSFVAEAHFHVGEQQYADEDYVAAAASFQAATQGMVRAEIAEQAWHKFAWSEFRQGQLAKAREGFREQLKKYPQGAFARDARFMQAECLFRQNDFETALAAFAEARTEPPAAPAMQLLLMLHGGQSAAKLSRWNEALGFLEKLPEQQPNSPLLPEILFERGRALQNTEKLDAALSDFERAASLSRTAVGARARFMVGEIQFQRKQYAEAIDTFRRVMFGFGADQAPEEVKTWQATAGFEAGRCAENQVKDAAPAERAKRINDAKTFYQYVLEKHPQSEFATQARTRLQGLGRLAN
jgi:TolA-binding protein